MELINVFINYDGRWTKNNHYVDNKLTGVLAPINATFEEFTNLKQKVINLDDQLTIQYHIQRGSTRISVENSENVKFYLELKKKETNIIAFPLCIMTKTSSTMPSNEGGNDLFQVEENPDPAIHQELAHESYINQQPSFDPHAQNINNPALPLEFDRKQSENFPIQKKQHKRKKKKTDDITSDDEEYAVVSDETICTAVCINQLFKNKHALKRKIALIALKEHFQFR